jgi:2-polyprenyl-3-methyl-5-hydroxy-6-metoxy-1,4-benzoquinol methylase
MKSLWDIKNPEGYYNRAGFYKTKTEYKFIKDHIPEGHNLKIIDLGGGSGRFAILLSKEGHEVTVVDKSEEAISLIKERGHKKAFCSDVFTFQSVIKYDMAIAIEVVDYFDDFVSFLNKVKSFTNNQSLFIFSVHNKDSWRFKIRNWRRKKTKYNNLFFKDYLKDISDSGFEIIDIKGFNWMPFRVNSNNILIPLFSKLESILRLNKWLYQSPWLLFACKKINK